MKPRRQNDPPVNSRARNPKVVKTVRERASKVLKRPSGQGSVSKGDVYTPAYTSPDALSVRRRYRDLEQPSHVELMKMTEVKLVAFMRKLGFMPALKDVLCSVHKCSMSCKNQGKKTWRNGCHGCFTERS